jgi:hypothetical protein
MCPRGALHGVKDLEDFFWYASGRIGIDLKAANFYNLRSLGMGKRCYGIWGNNWGLSKSFFFGFYFWGLVILYMLMVASFLLDKCLEIVIMRSLELGVRNNEQELYGNYERGGQLLMVVFAWRNVVVVVEP